MPSHLARRVGTPSRPHTSRIRGELTYLDQIETGNTAVQYARTANWAPQSRLMASLRLGFRLRSLQVTLSDTAIYEASGGPLSTARLAQSL